MFQCGEHLLVEVQKLVHEELNALWVVRAGGISLRVRAAAAILTE